MKKKSSKLFRAISDYGPKSPPVIDVGSILVLGVDPGTLVTGYGVVTSSGGGLALVACGTIKSDPSTPLPLRLQRIHKNLGDVIVTYHPHEFAIESAFYGKNAQSALKLGHARGVSLLAAAQHQLPTTEYAPREIKKAISGNGHASKEQISFMVRSILGIRSQKVETDASDAIAVAICHIHRMATPGFRFKDWKTFLQAYPERLVE